MRRKHTMKLVMLTGLFWILGACARTANNSDDEESVVAETVSTQISVINNATSDVNTGNGTALSLISPSESDSLRGSAGARITDFLFGLFDSSLHAISFTCSSGSVADTGTFGTAAPTITRAWNQCVGDGGKFRRNGTVYLGWSGLNAVAPYVQPGSQLKRATSNLTMTRVGTGSYVDIAGNDSANPVSGASANQILNWTAVAGNSRTFTLAINETRTGKSVGGTTLFQHTVTTPTILAMNVDTAAQTRTITSGTIRVHHVLANFNVDTTFNSAVWSISNCQPTSGSATVTLSGSRTGSGTLTFSSGVVTFSFQGNSGTLTLPGC